MPLTSGCPKLPRYHFVPGPRPEGELEFIELCRFPGTNESQTYWRDKDGQVWRKYGGQWDRVRLPR